MFINRFLVTRGNLTICSRSIRLTNGYGMSRHGQGHFVKSKRFIQNGYSFRNFHGLWGLRKKSGLNKE